MQYLNPAQVAYEAFGGASPVAKAVGRDYSAVLKWAKRKGGRIPEACLGPLFEAARARGIHLNPEELILGREIA